MKKITTIILLLSFFFFSACENGADHVKGCWMVLDINYQGKSLMNSVYTDNGIYINADNSITLPNSFLYYSSQEYRHGKWELLKKNNGVLKIRIMAKDTFMNNTYNVKFYQDKENSKYLLLESKNTTIRCLKT